MKFIKLLNQFRYTNIVNSFCKSNLRNFSEFFPKTKYGNKILLIELNDLYSAHIAYSYFVNYFIEKERTKVIGFQSLIPKRSYSWLFFEIKKMIKLPSFRIYKSFGTSRFIYPKYNRDIKKESIKIYNDEIKKINNLVYLEKFKIKEIIVGDLIYDSYLKDHGIYTPDLKSKHFKTYFLRCIQLTIYWINFFEKNTISAINVSHCVYLTAIPLRVALSKNIPSFQINLTHLYRLNKNNMFAYTDFKSFPKTFESLDKKTQKRGLDIARDRIIKRFKGEVGVDMSYSTKSAYGNKIYDKLLKVNKKTKVLVAAHCFFDSPHSYGNNIFPDFFEWIKFLGEFSEMSDYDWYIKTHPDFIIATKNIIKDFVKKYPKFTLLPSDCSHHQIIKEGINVALTVYGTIGFEYAALGVPVINASINNPHIAYNFNLHPKSIQEYKHMLQNLDNLVPYGNKDKIYEFYFMRNIYNTENFFFLNYQNIIKRLGGYNQQFTPNVFPMWLSEININRHYKIKENMKNFIESGDFRAKEGFKDD